MRRELLAWLTIGICWSPTTVSFAGVLLETASLDHVGTTPVEAETQIVRGTNVNGGLLQGVRFFLEQPTYVTEVGGHFLRLYEAPENNRLFGALVALTGPNDFPDSHDLATPDVLGVGQFELPTISADTFASVERWVEPGWYAAVFGAEQFGAGGIGGIILGDEQYGSPGFFSVQPGHEDWSLLQGRISDSVFRGTRFVVRGVTIPEPSCLSITLITCLACSRRRKS